MKKSILWATLITLLLITWGLTLASAAGKPVVTQHEAKFLENAVNMHIEWQSHNPVTLVKISMPSVIKEIEVDPYDNRRNPDGYSGEVDVTLNVTGLTGAPFTYVVQLQDELKLRSEPATGQIKILIPVVPGGAVPGMPGQIPAPVPAPMPMPMPAPQPPFQIQGGMGTDAGGQPMGQFPPMPGVDAGGQQPAPPMQ